MFVFVGHNVLMEKESLVGYSMLCILHSYLDLDLFESLEVHTSNTIALGHQAVSQFSAMLKV